MRRTAARVVIAEPWAILRRGLVSVVQSRFLVVGDDASAGNLRPLFRDRPVDLAVIGEAAGSDLVMIAGEVRSSAGAPPLVLLTDGMDAERLRALLRVGVRGVLDRKVEDAVLLDSLERVLDGDRVIEQAYLPLLYGDDAPDDDFVADTSDGESELLTRREREVLGQLARGFTNRQIAETLLLGESTVKTHLGRIYSKLEVDDRHHAVGRALELGLLR